jgi:hypothetical protein
MSKDSLTELDVTNTLRGGVVQPCEWENGEYRYRVLTSKIAVVISFASETLLVIVTAWRIK